MPWIWMLQQFKMRGQLTAWVKWRLSECSMHIALKLRPEGNGSKRLRPGCEGLEISFEVLFLVVEKYRSWMSADSLVWVSCSNSQVFILKIWVSGLFSYQKLISKCYMEICIPTVEPFIYTMVIKIKISIWLTREAMTFLSFNIWNAFFSEISL